MPLSIRIIAPDVGDVGPAAMVISDKHRILLGCPEGTQRFCAGSGLRLGRTTCVLLSTLEPDDVGGLPGALLTLADVGVRGLRVGGPVGLRPYLRALRHFASRTALDVQAVEASPAAARVDVGVSGFHAQPLLLTACTPGHPPPDAGHCVAWLLHAPDTPGRFYPERARALGVPKGPLFGALSRGRAVTLPSGAVVQAAQCADPPAPGIAVLWVRARFVAEAERLSCLWASDPELQALPTRRRLLVLHASTAPTMHSEQYLRWASRLGGASGQGDGAVGVTHISLCRAHCSRAPPYRDACFLTSQLHRAARERDNAVAAAAASSAERSAVHPASLADAFPLLWDGDDQDEADCASAQAQSDSGDSDIGDGASYWRVKGRVAWQEGDRGPGTASGPGGEPVVFSRSEERAAQSRGEGLGRRHPPRAIDVACAAASLAVRMAVADPLLEVTVSTAAAPAIARTLPPYHRQLRVWLTPPAAGGGGEQVSHVSSGPASAKAVCVESSGAVGRAAQSATAAHAGEGVPPFTLVPLGTGSAVPSKYRNVTGLLLRIGDGDSSDGGDRGAGEDPHASRAPSPPAATRAPPPRACVLLDCGEGTMGQAMRLLGDRGVEETLRSLHCVVVSHAHADHHLGLPRLLLARARGWTAAAPSHDVRADSARAATGRKRPRERSAERSEEHREAADVGGHVYGVQPSPPPPLPPPPPSPAAPGNCDGAAIDSAAPGALAPLLVVAPPAVLAFLAEYGAVLPALSRAFVGVRCGWWYRRQGWRVPGWEAARAAAKAGDGGDASWDRCDTDADSGGEQEVATGGRRGGSAGSVALALSPPHVPTPDVRAPGVRLWLAPVRHIPHSYACRVEWGAPVAGPSPFSEGHGVAFSGDTRPCRGVVELARRACLLVHEATFSPDMQHEAVLRRHSTSDEAVGVANAAAVQHLLLTHFSQRYPKLPPAAEDDDVRGSAARPFVGVACDHMVIAEALLPKLPEVGAIVAQVGVALQDEDEADPGGEAE